MLKVISSFRTIIHYDVEMIFRLIIKTYFAIAKKRENSFNFIFYKKKYRLS